jgi:hypothetical protein
VPVTHTNFDFSSTIEKRRIDWKYINDPQEEIFFVLRAMIRRRRWVANFLLLVPRIIAASTSSENQILPRSRRENVGLVAFEEPSSEWLPLRESQRMLQTTSLLPLTAFGQDLNVDGSLDPLPSFPNSDAARDEFNMLFDFVETEDFESFQNGQPLPLTSSAFSLVGPATLAGGTGSTAFISQTGNNMSRLYATSPIQFLFVSADQDFEIQFEQPVSLSAR